MLRARLREEGGEEDGRPALGSPTLLSPVNSEQCPPQAQGSPVSQAPDQEPCKLLSLCVYQSVCSWKEPSKPNLISYRKRLKP